MSSISIINKQAYETTKLSIILSQNIDRDHKLAETSRLNFDIEKKSKKMAQMLEIKNNPTLFEPYSDEEQENEKKVKPSQSKKGNQ